MGVSDEEKMAGVRVTLGADMPDSTFGGPKGLLDGAVHSKPFWHWPFDQGRRRAVGRQQLDNYRQWMQPSDASNLNLFLHLLPVANRNFV